MTTSVPRPRLLFFGVGDVLPDEGRVLQADKGANDNGQEYLALAISQAVVPAIPSQEVLVFATYLTVTHQIDAAQDIDVLLYVDDRPPFRQTITVPTTTTQQISRFEVGWTETVQQGELLVSQAPRGYRLRVGVETTAVADGQLDLDGVECEVEVRSEGISPSGVT